MDSNGRNGCYLDPLRSRWSRSEGVGLESSMESEDAHASPGEQPVPVAALSSAAYRRLAFRVVSGYVPQSTFVWSEKDSATLIGLMVKAAKDKLPRDQVLQLSLDPRVIREKEKNPRVEILLGVTPVTLSWIHHNEAPRFEPIRTFLATAGIVTQEGVSKGVITAVTVNYCYCNLL